MHHRSSAYHHHYYHGTASRFLHTIKDVGIAEIYNGSKHTISSNKDDDSDTTKNYIFGYGSLMCPESRQITNANLMNKYTVPVLIRDLQRQWCARTTTGYTAMGVQFTPGRCCTGILIGAVDADELADLDQREASYNRFSM
jgi:cation transport regulator ChaC